MALAVHLQARGAGAMDGKDDDEMDAVLNKSEAIAGKRKSKSATHKGLITHNLRTAYHQVENEPVPQHLLDILNKIEEEDDQP